jgi:ketosteroid isomerase-like protein
MPQAMNNAATMLRAISLAVCLAVPMLAAETSTETVMRTDAARLEAMRKSDGAALAKILSDDVVFIHSDGRSESKRDYIKNMTAGDTAYIDLKTSEVQARQIATDVIVLSGAQEMKKKLGPTWSEIKIRFMSVWRNEGGTWRMVAWQSMKPSGNSVVPPKP